MLSMYSAPEGVINKMDIYRKRLLWQGGNTSRKFHLANWNIVCLPKDQGGLGVIDLRCMNFSLLAKWIWRLESTEGLWQQIVRRKYIKGNPLILVDKKQEDSYFWKGLMNVKDTFYKFCRKKFGNGNRTSFWHDVWIGDQPFCVRFKRLWDISENRNICVDKVICSNFEALKIQRRLFGDTVNNLDEMKHMCRDIHLTGADDSVSWTLDKKGFSAKSLYKKIRSDLSEVPFKFLWKVKIPQKIKIFLWLIARSKILSKGNLIKRMWKGGGECCFCGLFESTDHLFFLIARWLDIFGGLFRLFLI
jgi:hypothetical protein